MRTVTHRAEDRQRWRFLFRGCLNPGCGLVDACRSNAPAPQSQPVARPGPPPRGGGDGLNWLHCDGLNWPRLRLTGGRLSRLIELERKAPEGMGSRVEQLEQIRRDRDREGLSL